VSKNGYWVVKIVYKGGTKKYIQVDKDLPKMNLTASRHRASRFNSYGEASVISNQFWENNWETWENNGHLLDNRSNIFVRNRADNTKKLKDQIKKLEHHAGQDSKMILKLINEKRDLENLVEELRAKHE